MMYRLPPVPGEWIDRWRELSFEFEGRSFKGFAGDTIGSALAAAGVMTLGRSFKYHRPRGILFVRQPRRQQPVPGGHVFVGIGAQRARRRHAARRGHARDRREHRRRTRARSRALHRMAGAVSPRGLLLQGVPRPALSALGAANSRHVRTRCASTRMRRARARPSAMRFATCWSLAPAQAASRPRCRPPMRAHACCWWMKTRARAAADAGVAPSAGEIESIIDRVAASSSIELLTSTYAAGYYADHWVALVEPTRMTKVRAGAVVFATGVIEQPAVFRNNDLPGVMSGSAAQRLLHRHGIAPGKRIAILTANREGYELARVLRSHLDSRGGRARSACWAGRRLLWTRRPALCRGRDSARSNCRPRGRGTRIAHSYRHG